MIWYYIGVIVLIICLAYFYACYIVGRRENKKRKWYFHFAYYLIFFIYFVLVCGVCSQIPYEKKFNARETYIKYDTLIVIKNGVADTTITYQVKREQ